MITVFVSFEMPFRPREPWKSNHLGVILMACLVVGLFVYSQSNLKYLRGSKVSESIFGSSRLPSDFGSFRLHSVDRPPSSRICTEVASQDSVFSTMPSNSHPVRPALVETSIIVNPLDPPDREADCSIWSSPDDSVFSLFSAVSGSKDLLSVCSLSHWMMGDD